MASTIGTALGEETPVIEGIGNQAYGNTPVTFVGVEGTFTLKQLFDFYNDKIADLEARIVELEGA